MKREPHLRSQRTRRTIFERWPASLLMLVLARRELYVQGLSITVARIDFRFHVLGFRRSSVVAQLLRTWWKLEDFQWRCAC